MQYLGWIANVLVVVGTFLIGEKRRSGFAWIAIGEALWVITGAARNEADIAVICIIFTVMAMTNYYKWGVAGETT